MKVGALLFGMGTVFFGALAIIYWILSGEVVGTVALVLTTGLALMIGFYLWYTERKLGPQPEDDFLGNIEDAEPDYGFFSPTSWWPMPLAGAAAITALGFLFAVWIVILGIALMGIMLIGFVFEYYRGAWAE